MVGRNSKPSLNAGAVLSLAAPGHLVLAVVAAVAGLVEYRARRGAWPVPPPAEMRTEMHLPGSHYHRLSIWNFTADRVAERPIVGRGLETSKVIPGNKTRPDGIDAALPLHPHNAALQMWLELGVAAAAGCFVSATVFALISYGIWQSWWLPALTIAGASMTLAYRSQ
jgi:O-antigen ligase